MFYYLFSGKESKSKSLFVFLSERSSQKAQNAIASQGYDLHDYGKLYLSLRYYFPLFLSLFHGKLKRKVHCFYHKYLHEISL